jgi:hypothetical protein
MAGLKKLVRVEVVEIWCLRGGRERKKERERSVSLLIC